MIYVMIWIFIPVMLVIHCIYFRKDDPCLWLSNPMDVTQILQMISEEILPMASLFPTMPKSLTLGISVAQLADHASTSGSV